MALTSREETSSMDGQQNQAVPREAAEIAVPGWPDRVPAGIVPRVDASVPNVARIYDYLLLRHEALRYRVEVRDLRRRAVAAA
jgi:hypothetical protein